jgi:hypothetical protein
LNETRRGGRSKYLQSLIKKAGIPSSPEHRPDLSNPMDSKISASETVYKWNVAFPRTSIKFAGEERMTTIAHTGRNPTPTLPVVNK